MHWLLFVKLDLQTSIRPRSVTILMTAHLMNAQHLLTYILMTCTNLSCDIRQQMPCSLVKTGLDRDRITKAAYRLRNVLDDDDLCGCPKQRRVPHHRKVYTKVNAFDQVLLDLMLST